MDETTAATGDLQQGKLAAGLAAAALITMFVLAGIDHDGPAWILQGVLGLAAAVIGFRAGGTNPKNTLAFAGMVIGTILFLIFAGYLIAEM